jgi:hypothetical protein
VTTLPLWSLAAAGCGLPSSKAGWAASLQLAGESTGRPQAPELVPLSADHYGFLVYLLEPLLQRPRSKRVDGLRSSPDLPASHPERGRSLLKDLQGRGLVDGAVPTSAAEDLVMRSPYAHYVSALREVNRS